MQPELTFTSHTLLWEPGMVRHVLAWRIFPVRENPVQWDLLEHHGGHRRPPWGSAPPESPWGSRLPVPPNKLINTPLKVIQHLLKI